MKNKLKQFWKKNKVAIKYILVLFIVTRILLTVIGVSSQVMMEPYHGEQYVWEYSESRYLDIWGVWDTGWYLNVVDQGYDTIPKTDGLSMGKANYAFFPLYPLLIKGMKYITGNSFTAGIIVSNLALLIACFYLFKLVQLETNKKDAYKAVKFMILCPVAFILSGVFSEATFLALLIASFYYAKKKNWGATGIVGFLLALTRPVGVFVVIPLAYEYLKSTKYKFKQIRPDFLFLFLIPIGLFLFMYYNHHLTGDWMAFSSIQSSWNRAIINPLRTLYDGMFTKDIYTLYLAWPTVFVLVVLTIFYKKIGLSYWFVGMYLTIIPLLTGLGSMPRYMLTIFPLYILLAKLSRNQLFNQIATITLALLQGFMMVFWASGFKLII